MILTLNSAVGLGGAIITLAAAVAAVYFFDNKRKDELIPETATITGESDGILVQACMLDDGKRIIEEAQHGLSHDQWRELEAEYSIWLIQTCKAAMRRAAKNPTNTASLKETDYISASILMEQLVAFASQQLEHPVKSMTPSNVPAKQGLPIKQMTLTEKNVSTIIDELRQGQRMLIINIANVENEDTLKRALKLIKRTSEAQDGAVLGLGTDWLVATHAIPINTQGGEKHGII